VSDGGALPVPGPCSGAEAWAPANGKEDGVPSVPVLENGPSQPEDYANIVLALHCLSAVILIIGSRKFFMRRVVTHIH